MTQIQKPIKKSLDLQRLIKEMQVTEHGGQLQGAFRAYAKAFLLHLAPMVADDGSCFDSYENISRILGCSRPTLTKVKNYWVAEGILTWTEGHANQHDRKANVYHFDEAAMQERLKAQSAQETNILPKQQQSAQETNTLPKQQLCLGNNPSLLRKRLGLLRKLICYLQQKEYNRNKTTEKHNRKNKTQFLFLQTLHRM